MSDNISDLYPLSPLQQGMLFHVLKEQGTGLYFNQLACELRGALDLAAFTEAWRLAVEAFPILRTAIVWEDVDEPLQVVLNEVELPLLQEDWRGTPASEREARFTSWLEEDRRRGVELGTPPLLRLSLLRTGDAAYRFVFSYHHILLDGWSVPLLIRRIFVLYESLARGLPPRVEQARPYRDYIEWLQERGLEESERFWRHMLAGFSEPTDLGRSTPRAGAPSPGRATRKVHLSAASTEALNTFVRQHGLTLNTVLQGAWALLLGHHAGTDDVVFGTTVSGRPPELPGVEGMVGLFINTLPVRVRFSPDEPLVPWLQRLQASLLELRQHEHSPLVKVQRWSEVPAGTPLFDNLVVFENYPVDAALTASLPSLEVRDVRALESDHHPLTLISSPGRELPLHLAYDRARFDTGDIDQRLGQLRHLLESMVARPEQRLGALSPVDGAERHRLLREWSGAGTRRSEPATLHRLFEARAAAMPDGEALVFGRERLTYGELDARANQLAHHLLGLGVGAESRVVLCLERSPELIIAMLGVLKAGGAYVPLEPTWPAARLRAVVEDSGASVVLAQARTATWLEGLGVRRVLLDGEAEALAREPRTSPGVRVHPGQVAYVIYTSGSTGKPKGVLVEHRGVGNTLWASREAWAVGPGKRVLQCASASFDASVYEIFMALLEGATLVLAPREALLPGAELARVLREERVTTTLLTPSVLEVTSAEGLPALETVVSGAEACHPGLVERWGRGRRFVNAYGPTESSICATSTQLSPGTTVTPIGRPLTGTRAYVLDASLRPVSTGARGELYLGGAGVTRGYLGRPELTAERFVPDPFSEEPGARLYRTGDVARWLPDGQLEFLGRADSQVKLRGFRIELGEIEAALRAQPGIREAVVALRSGASGEQSRLVAWVVPVDGQEPSVRELRERLGTRLPEYMVPAAFVVLEALPLTTSGKVDRRALPAPELSREESASHVPPRTPEERALAEVWAQVLGHERVGIHDNFFELGGDSILAIQIISRAAQAGIHLTAKQLFSQPTVAGLAEVAGSAPGVVAEQEAVTGPVVLTPIQRWFLEQEQPAPHHYNQALLLIVREPWDAALLEQALQHLRLHHDALRMRFSRSEAGWHQEGAGPEGHLPLERVDLSGLEPEARRAALETHAGKTQASLELQEGRLARAVLYELGAGEPRRLLLAINHLVVDGVSWRVLLTDLVTAWAQLRAGEPVRLPPKTTSFQQWAERLEAYAQTPAVRQEAESWLALPWERVSRLPVDVPGGEDTVGSARTLRVELDAEATRTLVQEVPRAWRMRVDEVLLAALAESFRRWTGASCVQVDLEGHGREDVLEGVDLSRTVGWFTSLYPVLLETGAGQTPESGLKAIKESLRRIPQRGLGFGVARYLSRESELTERLRALPASEVAFNYLGQFDNVLPAESPLVLAPEPVGATQDARARLSHSISINALISGGCLQVSWTYAGQLYRSETLESLSRGFLDALRSLLGRCTADETASVLTPSDFPLARLGQKALDALVARVAPGGARGWRGLEELYPLSPLQLGMLFHALQEEGNGLYFNQLVCELRGELDLSAFKEAWRQAVGAHSILRTAIAWEELAEPLQVVFREAELPLLQEDWRGVSELEQEARLTTWLEEDRRRSFDLSSPTLSRLALLRTGEAAYRFIFSHHHIVLDGWSVPVLIRGVFALYGQLSQGLAPRVEQARPYRDYISWFQQRGLEESERFWRHTLAGFSEPTDLGRRSALQEVPGAGRMTRKAHLSAASTEALNAFVRQHGLTLNTVLQGAWALLLGHHAGTSDVVFGTTVSGRPPELPGVEGMVGLFINTLPVRVRFSPDEPLVPWLQRLQAWLLELRQHEHSPLVKVQRWSEVPAGTPLFESLVVFENYPVDAALTTSLPSLEVRDVRALESDHHPLTLVSSPGRELPLHLSYDGGRFDTGDIDQRLGQLRHLLESMVARPEQRLGALSPVDAAEQQRLLREWSGAGTRRSEPATLHRLFEARAAEMPDGEALVFGRERLTYAELDARANQLAHHLRGLGVGPESRVVLCLERSPELIIAMLGVLKAGGAYVPVDPSWPAARLQTLSKDSGASCVIAQERTAAWLEGQDVRRVLLDTEATREALAREPRTSPGVRVHPGQVAYVIYTSGSTGKPKGVLVEHRGVGNTLWASREAWAVGPGKRVLQYASASFDASVYEIFMALLEGATLVLAPREALLPGAELARVLREERVTTTLLTPSVLEVTPAEGLPALETVLAGAEACHPGLVERWGRGRRFVNAYGPTESSICATVTECSPGMTVTPIGRPLPGTRAYVLDARLCPVSTGARGELYLGGAGVTRGYLGRPELTAERFIPDPFSEEPGARLYRTGDVARWLPDGQLEFLGRADSQVKLRGFRIELGEIEAALRAQPSVGEAVVVLRKRTGGEPWLVAYVVARAGGPELSARELREGLGTRLPEYMVPAAFVVLEALPLTTSGKVDRHALPAPERSREETASHEPPRTAVEQTLAEVWAQVLGHERVGIHDNFFELGGDSILAIQIISRAAQAGVHLTAKQLFTQPTVAKLAEVAGSAPGVVAEQEAVTGPVVLTPIQRWFLEQEQPAPHHFNQTLLLAVREPWDAALLEQALQHLRLHHDALRMRFSRSEAGWRQEGAGPEGHLPLERVDLSGLEPEARRAALEEHAARTQASLELPSGRVARAVLYELGAGEPRRLLLAINHLVVDGVSWRVLLTDLVTAWAQLRAGEPVRLPPKTTSFRQWAQRLEAYAQTPAVRREAESWLALPWERVSRLPVDVPGGEDTVGSARTLRVELDAEETRTLVQEVPRAWRMRVDEVLLAALAESFRRWTGASCVQVDLEGHGREDVLEGVDLSRTVGWFTSLYPVLLETGTGQTPESGLKAIKESLRRIPQGGLGFGVARYLSREPELAERLRGLPASEVAFNYLGQFDNVLPAESPLVLASEPVGATQDPRARLSHRISVNAVISGGRLQVSWTYAGQLYRSETLEALSRGFLDALHSLLRRCTADEAASVLTPSDFPLAPLGQPSLDALVEWVARRDARRRRSIEDVYPLSPLQQGLLFHVLHAPGSDLYLNQLVCELRGDLDLSAFARAWRQVVEAHSILRTAIAWEGVDEPLQVVLREAELPLLQEDWRGVPASEHEARFASWLEEDRRRSLELSSPPLCRLALLRTGEAAWRFVFSHHHLLMDGWSVPVLIRGVFALYEQLSQGLAPRMERTRPYRDYIGWLQARSLEESEHFWRHALAGFSEPTDLGRGTASVDRTGAGRETRQLHLSAASTEALNAFARQHGLTLNTVVQGAWALLLGHHAGARDVVFGTTVSGRPPELPGVEGMVGLFINTLPVRVKLPSDEPLVPWLRRLQGWLLELRQHEHSPLVKVQRWSEVPAGTPLFESLVVFENYPVDTALASKLPSLEVRDVRSLESDHHPLTLIAMPGRELPLHLAYDGARFDAGHIDRMLGQLRHVLESMVARPEQRLGELSPVDAAERHLLLKEWSGVGVPSAEGTLLHRLFEKWAAETPEAEALVFERERLTYGEVEARANQLAHHLRGLGVGAESRVVLSLERSPELIIAMLGVLKAGGVYVPVDPAWPAARLQTLLKDSGASRVIAQERTAGWLEGQGVQRVMLDTEPTREALAREPRTSPGVEVHPGQLAYVIYTSGSTGKPKGVLVEHRGACNTIVWACRDWAAGPGKRVLQVASASFDVSVFDIFGTFHAGAVLVMAPRELLLPGAELLRVLREERVAAAVFTPSVLEATPVEELPALESVMVAGEACSPRLPQRWGEGRRFVNAYGPTEVSIYATRADCASDAVLVPIGRPLPGVRAYVLDARLRPVAVGVRGELYLGGVGVARGYLDRPELTAERFLPDPFCDEGGARMYRTGDVVRWMPDGQLEFFGRVDEQVKLRGFRIELGEIEAALCAEPSVGEAVVVLRKRTGGEPWLVAYMVARAGGPELSVRELRERLREKLPEYMVPSAFVVLEALPRTTSGKVDRKALPQPGVAPRSEGFVAPRTDTERRLAELWTRTLGVERVGVEDSFFDLGGHSLLATQLVSRVRGTFRVELPLRAVFEAPTLEALARRVEEAPRLVTGPEAPPPLVARPGAEPVLGFAQQRLWFLDRLQPGSTAYNLPYALKLEGVLDVAALERGLEEVVRRHEALQASFESQAGEPVVRLAGPLRLPLAPVDLSALEAGQRSEEVARLASEESGRPFELSRGPLLRARLLRLGEREHVLLLTVHHIVFDGWSAGLLFQELAALYGAFSRGAPSPLAELPLQYTDYARWQREWLRGEALQLQLSYWRQRLADSPPVLELPLDRPRPARRSTRAGRVPVSLSRELSETLGALAQREGSSLFMVLLAGFQALLGRWSGQEDIAVGTPVAGRTRAEVEGLIGFFVNMLVLRTELSGAPTFRELVARVREVALGAYAHQDVPFEKLVEELKPVRNLGSSPLFQVMFVLQNVPAREVSLPELKLSAVDQEEAEAKLDLTLALTQTPEGLRGIFSYDAALFEPATIERLARHLETLLAAVAVAPDRRVAEVELLVGEERARVLEEWSRGPRVEGPVEGLGRLLERQAARTPEAVAVEGGGQRLSYQELEARARHLAYRLRREGVGPEKRVGVLLEKSVEAVVAFWGVQLAGGVYVPLEAVQPPERLAWMAEDAGVCAVVTRRGLEARCRLAEGVRVVRLEDVGEAEAVGALGAVHPDNAAYILYTSGSTGRPKGVVVTHEGACDLVRGKAGAFGVGAESRVLQFSSLGFDVSLWDYLLTLAVGGTLYVPAGGKVPLGEELRRELVEGAVTVLALPPSVLALLPDEGLEHLRVVMAAGEACPPELVERWGKGRRFVNGYGPTEVSVLATWEECVPGEGRPPIGRPLANTRTYVLDGAMRPVPPGVAGELYLGGPGLARGYVGRPELTAERFVPDAFSGEPGARLYRTGDVVRWRADGRLDYLGRVDAQVKVNGVRVEPGEVETALRELAGARQAHVKAWRSPSGESRLVAYVVPGESTPREERELRARLRQRLMEAMVPSVCVYLETLPLTSSGKVDGRALPAPEEVRPAGRAFVAPRDEWERELAHVWEEVLGVRPVGVTDSFFELGGQSLLAVRLVARLQERLGRAVPLAVLFEAPTLEDLALRLRAGVPASGHGNHVTLQPEGTLTPVFWVHPVGGNVLCYAELARHLGPKRPFHALQATGLDGREAPLASVEDMARRYVEQVRAVQSEGPYLLGGWSLGGAVAFEMARELRRQGQEVASLVLLDSFAPTESPPPEPDEATLLAGFAADLARSAGREVLLTPESLAGLTDEERLRTLWTRAREARLVPPGTGLEELRALLAVARANLRAVARYNPQPYEGQVVLFRARDARRGAEVEPTHGWARLVSSGLTVEDVPGDHHGVLRSPHVGELAERLERWLQQAELETGAQRTG